MNAWSTISSSTASYPEGWTACTCATAPTPRTNRCSARGGTIGSTATAWSTGSASPREDRAPLENKASYGRKYVRTRGFEQEERQGAALYTGLRDINPIWDVLIPRLVKKIAEWRNPDSPFWVIQSKNTANNGVKYHAGKLLATYESGSAYELELGRDLRTKGLCDFNQTLGTVDYW